MQIHWKKLMILHHTNACHGLGAAYVKDFCISIN